METFSNMYFDVSLIIKKTASSKQEVFDCLFQKFDVKEGENENTFFGKRKIIAFHVEIDESDFDEICIDFSEQVFHRDSFKEELEVFAKFANICFECNSKIEYVVCSYELNGYLLRNIKYLDEFNEELLNKFPVSFKKVKKDSPPIALINLDAQEI